VAATVVLAAGGRVVVVVFGAGFTAIKLTLIAIAAIFIYLTVTVFAGTTNQGCSSHEEIL